MTSFAPASLSLLPRHLRRALLLNLPAINISWLETTSFICPDGNTENRINMQDIWVEVLSSRVNRSSHQWPLHRYFDDSQFLGNVKDHFFMRVYSALLNRTAASHECTYRELVFSMLFSVRNCLGIFGNADIEFMSSDSYVVDLAEQKIIPVRYATLLSTSMTDTALLQFIMEEARYGPSELHVICARTSGGIWDLCEEDSAVVLRTALSCVEELKIGYYGMFTTGDPISVPLFVIETIVACGKTRLRNLIIDANANTLEGLLERIGPIFHSRTYTFRYYPTPSSLLCTNLEQLAISTATSASSLLSRSTYVQLASILRYQRLLSRIHLDGPFLSTTITSSHGTKQFLSALISFVMQSNFSMLILELRDISLPVAQQLVGSFLLSPSTQVIQRLVLREFSICQSLPEDTNSPFLPDLPHQIVMDDRALDRKSLQFRDITPTAPLLHWLFSQSCLRLCTLNVSTGVDRDVNIVRAVAGHPDFKLRQLCLCSKLSKAMASPEDVTQLLQKPELSMFDLYDCLDALDSTLVSLSSIANGLFKQSQVGHLHELSLEKNGLGRFPYAEVQLLFNAIFSFPALEQLGVNLRQNDLTAHHAELMYDSWKSRAHGQLLKRLDYHNNRLPEDTWCLEQVTSNLLY